MSLSSLNLIGQSIFELESGNENVDGQTDGQTDVGHINLIGGLVTRNPPKKDQDLILTKGNLLVAYYIYLR